MISFIVPAYNEEELLPGTLHALHGAGRSSGETYEIVVADDGSTDRTPEIAAEMEARVVPVRYRQISRTRNAGARAATGDPLFFVDADTIVPPSTVRAALEAIRGGAVGGTADMKFDGEVPLYGRLVLPAILSVFRLAKLGGGAFLYCTREAFERVGGFDEEVFVSEEIGFSHALGQLGDFVFLDQAVTTSGRKLRDHSARDVLRQVASLAVRGKKGVRSREALDLWYAQRDKKRSDDGAE